LLSIDEYTPAAIAINARGSMAASNLRRNLKFANIPIVEVLVERRDESLSIVND
jgi:hypothetical protein